MKIIMTLSGLDIGGAETHVTELAKELKRRGHDLAIISGGGVYQKEIEDFGIRHYTVRMNRRNPLEMLRAVRELKRILQAEKPDIVHAHARIPAFLMGIAHKSLRKKCPFVYVTTVHGAYDTAFPLKLLTCWGQMSLAVSDDLKKYLVDNYGIKPENVFVSINGIDTNRFSPNIDGSRVASELGLEGNAKCLVCVTRLDPRICGHAYALMDIMPDLDRAVPGIVFVLVGDGDAYSDLLEKSKAVNDALGRKAVILTGGRTDVNEILACADVCVGVSRAILEPMAMEKKCVIVGEWGYIGILDESNLETARGCNFTCRNCDAPDKKRLAEDIIKQLTCNAEEGKKSASFGREVVLKYYAASKMADDNEKMYRHAMRHCKSDAVILGYYGYRNCGDDALLRAIIDDIRKLSPDCGITVLSHDPTETMKSCDVEAAYRFSLGELFRVMKHSKLFILGGGSLVQDVTSTKSLLYYLFCTKLSHMLGLKVMLYANGIGPVNKRNNRKIARILNSVDVITLRDGDSAELLSGIGVTKPRIAVTADPAFDLDCADKESAKAILSELGVNGGFVCFSGRPLAGKANSSSGYAFTSDLAAFADYINEKYGLTPVFITMQYSRDKVTCDRVIAGMKTHGVLIDRELDVGTVLGVISLSEAVVAVRLHMLIFGTLMGVPVFGIEYDPKVKSFAKQIGSEYTVLPSQLSAETGEYRPMFDRFMANREATERLISEKLPSLREKAKKNAEIAVELMKQAN